jgi:hypothetical protein
LAEDKLPVGTEDLFANYHPEDDHSPIETDDLFAQHSTEDHLFETRDLFADFDRVEGDDALMDPFNSENYILSSNSEGGKTLPPKKPSLRYTIDPNTPQNVDYKSAYADDGITPIKKGTCPDGKKRTCCEWYNPELLNKCWSPTAFSRPLDVCVPAMNQFCCKSVTFGLYRIDGGIGHDCERAPWVMDVRRMRQQSKKSSPEPSEIDLQELFPILQPLPEPNPGYCSQAFGTNWKKN